MSGASAPARKRHAWRVQTAVIERLPCFTAEQWAEWHAAANDYRLKNVRSHPCQDCTPEYQASMNQQARCHFPQVHFVSAKGEGVVGVFQPTPTTSTAL